MMSDRVDPHRTAIKGRQTSARRVAADLWLTAIFGDRLAVREKEDDHDGAGPRQADVADRRLGNVGHSGSDFVSLAVQGRRASRLSGGPSCAVSQGGSRGLAGATS